MRSGFLKKAFIVLLAGVVLIAGTRAFLVYDTGRMIKESGFMFRDGETSHFLITTIEDESVELIAAAKKVMSCQPSETVVIHLASYGGDVGIGTTLAKAMSEAPCQVDVVVESFAMSAASWIAFSGHTIKFKPGSIFMIHQPRYVGLLGTTSPVALEDQKDLVELMDRLFGLYITDEDINGYLDGKDVYISGDEMSKRLAKGGIGEKGRFIKALEARIAAEKPVVK